MTMSYTGTVQAAGRTDEEEMTSDRFFAGFIAGLALLCPERPRLSATRVALNRAFHKAITSPAGHFVDRRQLAIDYDPLYRISPWFERALTRAQRDLLLGFSNPTYAAVDIKLKPEQAEKLLQMTGHREQFVALAGEFLKGLPASV